MTSANEDARQRLARGEIMCGSCHAWVTSCPHFRGRRSTPPRSSLAARRASMGGRELRSMHSPRGTPRSRISEAERLRLRRRELELVRLAGKA